MSKLYWKLQSVNNTEQIEVGSEEFQMYREKFKKNYETRELMSEEETLVHYSYNAWRSPLFSRIYSLTIAFVDKDNTLRVQYITGAEKDLLQTFLNSLKSEHFKDFQLVHADAEYMLPYLGTRLDIHGFRTSIHKDLQYKGLKPWNLTGVSVRDFYQGAGAYKHSLKEIAWVYGLERDYIEPVDEFAYLKAGKTGELITSAVNEIKTLVNVHRIMMGEEPVTTLKESTLYVEAVEEVKPTNFLAVLFESQAMTLEVRKGLTAQLTKKKITKREREVVREIILGVYIQNDFINGQQDTKATIEKKTKEVDEFLGTI
jgi:hypothetical protein|tara:strand:+ start:1750 stop:2694 length:945 start_codon:yes stop_codon:yes gene_type:complete